MSSLNNTFTPHGEPPFQDLWAMKVTENPKKKDVKKLDMETIKRNELWKISAIKNNNKIKWELNIIKSDIELERWKGVALE